MSHTQSTGDLIHRVGIWVGMIGLALYVLNIGQWVGAADEKFKGAASVEQKQEQLILDVNSLTVEQRYTKEAVKANTIAIETSRREILAAIKEQGK